ncbi:MAG TPA: carboxypeptidase regulatory-like domain-containing protein [Blastocatellia bacterium]|nr:carboxypeptidase regulatory-like domain-containing protein [Blastocatellia bacterium]
MRSSVRTLFIFCVVICALAAAVVGQVPTGGVRGSVLDPNKAAIKGATVTVKNIATSSERKTTTGTDGDFLIENLLPGEYELKISVNGFKTNVAMVTVIVGSTLTGEYVLEVGSQSETVVISGDTSAAINTTDNKVDGVVSRQQIDSLPLNGRNFLQLASLQPGVRVSTSSPGDANNLFNVSIGGGDSALTRLTVDGGSVVDLVTGSAGQNFSVESVQEFQISSFNFDLSTGVSSVGAINIVSRTGANDFHGSGFAYYRDRKLAAYPVLIRDPQNKEPFFRRLQSGGYLSGPIKKDKAFWFFNMEHLNQDSTFSVFNGGYSLGGVQPLKQFDAIASSPYTGLLSNARVDYKLNDKHSTFIRYSGDHNKVFAPVGGATLPSNWRVNKNDSDQAQGGWTWIARPNMVNDLRFNWQYVGNKSLIPTNSDCPNCLGLNGPQIRINGSSLILGNSTDAPQTRALHRYETVDNFNWTVGNHRVRFGGTWEKDYGTGSWSYLDPTLMVVHNPADIIQVNGVIDILANDPSLKPVFGPVAPLLKIPLPAAFTTPGAKITYQDILQLPVAVAFTGIGDPGQPPPFNVDLARRSHRLRFYGQDSWTAKPGFTFSYGMSYTYETNLWNHDLTKPALLSSIYGTTNPTPKDKDNFAPSIGFAWDVKRNAKTVVRGGFGMFYDTSLFVNRLTERALIGPLGNGRVQTTGDFFQNTIQFPQLPAQYQQIVPTVIQQLQGIAAQLPPGDQRNQLLQLAGFLPAIFLINPTPGTPINFQTVPTKFTAANFLTLLSQQVPLIQGQLNALGSQGVKGLDFFKVASGNGVVIDPFIKIPYSMHYSVGVQRELPMNSLLTLDFVLRRSLHNYFQSDRNLWDRAASLGGPVIPRCTGAAAINPTVRCTNGPIEILEGSNRSEYRAMLVKLEKRFSNRYAGTVSYSLSSLRGFNVGLDRTNLFGYGGPSFGDTRHLITALGQVKLPWGLNGSMVWYFASKEPFSAYLSGTAASTDLNGDGTGGDLLPGLQWNQGNRGINESELRTLVDNYNKLYAGKPTPRGGVAPILTLPSDYQFGDFFQTHDVRLSKEFKLTEKVKLELIGEVFNLFNISNLTGYGQSVDANFGKPSGKAGQAFSSGGPRATQFAARLKF